MDRQFVHFLVPGKSLGEAMYDENGRLLLDSGHTLTKEMYASLMESNKKFVYLGEWNAADFERYSQVIPLSDYRDVARQMGTKLETRLDSQLRQSDLNPEAIGAAFDERIDHSFKSSRSSEEIRKCMSAHSEGVKCMSDIAQGLIKADEVAEAATSVVDHLMKTFSTDASLLNNMTNLKKDSEYIFTHSVNTAILSINIATALKLDAKQVREVGIGGLLHNLGMSMVADEIVNTAHKFENVEHLDVQKHIGYGLFLLEKFRGLPLTTRIILFQNKERADGSGYPRRRSKNATHRFARIVAVADVYDAMTSDRPWRKAIHPYRTMEYLLSQARKKFDADIIRGLLQYMSLFPIGSFVSLNSGDIARVVHSNCDDFYHPIISVLFDEQRNIYSPPTIVDLKEETDIKVASVIEEDIETRAELGFT
jgi:HD-GYP domain-containing protein (c-di-GMP phosphodiesterase class II)